MLKIYNTLTRKKETFKSIKKGKVSMYTCGPTVYGRAHIGNLRTNIFYDIVKRSLEYLKLKVNHVMNITDVDDKTIRGSIRASISLQEFTRKYESLFLQDLRELNILPASKLTRATEYIDSMVSLIKELIKKGYAYKTSDGIYFNIEKSKEYGKIANLENVKNSKERIKGDEYDKEHAHDFALWKFHTQEDGQVFWDTEIGKGRPGWHIECSAMSTTLLGPTIDIHAGGADLLFPHHTNEIAQSEAATGKKFVNYWLHGGLLAMKEGKMSKSLGNILNLEDIKKQGFKAVHYRYFCLQTHYRKPLQFSLERLEAAKNAFERIKRRISDLDLQKKGKDLSKTYEEKFDKAISDDFNMPEALQVFIKALEDNNFDSKKKLSLLKDFNSVLGLNIEEEPQETPEEVLVLLKKRQEARDNKDWKASDKIREKIKELGYQVTDNPDGQKVEKI